MKQEFRSRDRVLFCAANEWRLFALSCLPANGLDKFVLGWYAWLPAQYVYVSSLVEYQHKHARTHSQRMRRNECVRWHRLQQQNKKLIRFPKPN